MVMTDEAPKQTTVRIDPELRSRVDAYADNTHRTLNGAINYLLTIALDQLELEAAATRRRK